MKLFKRMSSGIVLTLLLIGIVASAFNIQIATAELPVHNIDTGEDFATIQAAIYDSDTLDGHTIQVDAGIYYENVVVNKSISLIGESMETTIINGGGVGIAICVLADNVTINGFRIENYYDGGTYVYPCIRLYHSYGNNISGNIIVAEDIIGIWLAESSGNNFTGNLIWGGYSTYCIYLANSNSNVIDDNLLAGTDIAIYLIGSSYNLISRNDIGPCMAAGVDLESSCNNSIIENKIGTCFSCGIGLGNFSNENNISGNNITDTSMGITLSSSSNNTIYHNNIKNGGSGVYISSSSNNTFNYNNIENNQGGYGIEISSSSHNKFYHNSFIDNNQQTYITSGSKNVWDDGYPSGGNYWSDYTGTDAFRGIYQNETGTDGIGDTPYTANINNIDHYPLTKPYGGQHDIGIAKASISKPYIPEKYNATTTLNVTIINYGEQIENFNFTFQIGTITGQQTISLIERNSTTLTFTWNSTGYPKGSYTLKATADTVPGETYTTDNVYVSQIIITKAGDLGGGPPPEFFNFDNEVDGIDLALFIQCYKKLAPSEVMYLADLGGGVPPSFFNCDGKVDGKDLALWIECYKGRGPDP